MSGISLNKNLYRYTPSPSKSSCSNYSKPKVSMTPDFPVVYPSWLLQRDDFQVIYKEYMSLDKMDLISIFQKDPNDRKEIEKDAIAIFIQSSYFFDNILSPKILIRNFVEESFSTGENLCDSFNKKVFVILKGEVVVDNQLKLGPFNSVGEFQITENKNLNAVALGRVFTIGINEENYRILFMHSRLKQNKIIVPMLKEIIFFKEVKDFRLEKIASTAIWIQFEQGEEIYRVGDNSEYFFLVISGKVEISSEIKFRSLNNLPIGFKKREELLIEKSYFTPFTTIQDSDIFGLAEAIFHGTRKTSAKTLKKTVLVAFKWAEMTEIVTDDEKNNIVSRLSERFNRKTLTNLLKSKILKAKQHISALLDASQVKNTPFGRDTFEEVSKKKRIYAKILTDKKNKFESENLVSKSYSFRETTLPKIHKIYPYN